MTVRLRQGRWMLDIRHRHNDGRVERIRRAVPDNMQSRRKAEQYERQVLHDLRAGVDPFRVEVRSEEPAPEIPTLASFAETFMTTYVKTNNRASTGREKQRTLNRGLLPVLGHLRLDKIGPKEIEIYKGKRKVGRSNKTVNEELAVLSKLLDYANEIGVLPTPPPKIRRLKVQRPSFDFLDFEEAERLMSAAKNAPDPWSAMIPVAILTGLRLGELRGLQWDDVDLCAKRIHVQRAADDQGVLGPPKNNRERFVDLPQRAVAILRQHKHLRRPFAFCREDGSILQRWHCESKSKHPGPLPKLCRKAGLRPVGWHALRHTYASHLVMRGASLKAVQELLGHQSIEQTMRYAHLGDNARRSVVALLDEPAPDFGHILGTSTGGETKTAP